MSDQMKPSDWKMTEDETAKFEATGQEAEAQASADYEALMRLMGENEDLKDRALRAAAEMENLRRRTAREVADVRTYAIANFARDMLAVSDNLRRALDAIPPEARSENAPGLNALVDGVEMTERAMLSGLERHGVRKLEPQGEKFDPNFHQAMFEVPNADLPANTVVQVVQPGFSIGERVLRPAMVGVSKGGPSSVAKPAAAADVPKPGTEDALADKDA